MNQIARIFLKEIKSKRDQDNPDFLSDFFSEFYIGNWKTIHNTLSFEDIKKIKIVNAFVKSNRKNLKNTHFFELYISKFYGTLINDITSEAAHHVNIGSFFELSFIKKGLEFCLSENININKHTQSELDLFEINIIS